MIHKHKEHYIILTSGHAGPLVTGGTKQPTEAAFPEGGEVLDVIFGQLWSVLYSEVIKLTWRHKLIGECVLGADISSQKWIYLWCNFLPGLIEELFVIVYSLTQSMK